MKQSKEIKVLLTKSSLPNGRLPDPSRLGTGGRPVSNGVNIPKIAIVGRPNVGKSTLFNALLKKRAAIVDRFAGTTLDRISGYFRSDEYLLELVDTGGIDKAAILKQKINASGSLPLRISMRCQIQIAFKQADVILLVTDIRDGVTPTDEEIARSLRRGNKPIVLIANKADTMELESDKSDFFRLGLGEPMTVSALQKRGLDDLRDKITTVVKKLGFQPPDKLAEPSAPTCSERSEPIKIAIVGKRNTGKSTLVNSLAREERVVVSEIPGTTRDAIDVRFERDGEVFIAIDTAGIRRRQRPGNAVEVFSRFRTESAIQRADVIFFLIDALEKVSEVDKKIAAAIVQSAKPCTILINKWDLVKNRTTPDDYLKYLNITLPALTFAPVSFISARTGFNITRTIRLSKELVRQNRLKVPTSQLNKVLQQIKKISPPSAVAGKIPRIYYGTQTATVPPTITIFVNNPAFFTDNYQRFLINHLRKDLPFGEVPLRLEIRRRKTNPPRPARLRAGTHRQATGRSARRRRVGQ